MIFVILGSQKFQFNRLLKELDGLIEKGLIRDEVFAQTGYSDYNPKYYSYEAFVDRNKFIELIDKADIVITHGGTGAIISAVKKGKKVIAVSRLSKYGEHVDDHQMDIVNQFNDMNLIEGIIEISDLPEAINNLKIKEYSKYESNSANIISIIEDFINS